MAFDSQDKHVHLLQPIRDLAANWNINIANELEEYLEVLESVTFSFQGSQQSLNFAEAALVIQGSACVYSRKVEYLHSLVYQALEFIAERKVKALRSRGQGPTQAPEDDDEFDEEERFLTLDDTLEAESSGIDLDEEAQAIDLSEVRPVTLLAIENDEDRSDFFRFSEQIAACAVHHSGALLLDPRDGLFLDEQLRPIPHADSASLHPISNAMVVETRQVPAIDDTDPSDCGIDMIDDYGYGGDDAAWNDGGGAPPRPSAEEPAAALMPDVGKPTEEDDDVFDPYSPLDPTETSALPLKPIKRMKKTRKNNWGRIEHSRNEAPLELRWLQGCFMESVPVLGLLFPEFEYSLQHMQRVESSKAQKPLRLGLTSTGVKQPEFGAVFTKTDAEAFAAAETAFNDQANDYEDVLVEPIVLTGDDDMLDDVPLGDYDDFDMTAAFESALEPEPYYPVDALASSRTGKAAEMSYEDLCRAHVEDVLSTAAASEVQSKLAARVSAWRTKMTPVLEEEDTRPNFDIHGYGELILDGLAALSVSGENTKLARRCSDVRKKNAVEGEEYKAVGFGALMAEARRTHETSTSDYEVSRLFSSTLQLVNSGNLRISKLCPTSEQFTVTLVSTALPHREIGDYCAAGLLTSDPQLNMSAKMNNDQEDLENSVRENGLLKPANLSKRRKESMIHHSVV